MDYLITIALPGQSAQQITLPCGAYIVGRGTECPIHLEDSSVSELHAKLILSPTEAWIEDLGSSNGTIVNSVPVTTSSKLDASTIVSVGNTVFRVQPKQPAPQAPAPTPAPSVAAAPAMPPPVSEPAPPPVNYKARALRQTVKSQIHDELVRRLDLKRLTAGSISADELAKRVRETLQAILDEVSERGALPASIDPDDLVNEIYDESVRLGPVERFLADDSVTEVMINGPEQVYVERNGRLVLTDQTFMDDASVLAVIERIVAPLGRRIDESQPYVDARLADGSRVNAIIPPLSLIGPCITIRKFAKRVLTTEDFVRYGTWTPAIAAFLEACVKLRKNIIVAGGTGSGKTTLLNVLSGFIPTSDRILTIEDAAELRLVQPHVVRLEARPPNIEGKGAVTIRDLVRNALRMRPDRIIVGECRGGETLDMLQAMNTGHDGSLTTVHANSPRDVISRLETMVLMSGVDLPSRAIREQVASAVQIIVQEARLSDGSRKIVAISEITGMEGQQIVMQDLFVFRQTGLDANGRIQGKLTATGAMPTFFDTLSVRGLTLDPALFRPEAE
ncbi:MAG: Flp pilus assembly complex ATPase component TadA [Kiritimatiellae bacterium]|nr:Flp pilus assembly complex ATPase component TadA [Kiritimatiellia bacterium]